MSTSNNRYNNEIQVTWSNASNKICSIHKFSSDKLIKLIKTNNLSEITSLSLTDRNINKIDDLNGMPKLRRLDMSKNAITRLNGFNVLPELSMLNVSSNELTSDASLEELRYLTNCRTLNIGFNPKIKHIRSHVIKPLCALQVLIANDCGLSKVSFLKFLPLLNTLVLSKNKLTSFTYEEVGPLPNLIKLSLGNNEFTTIPDLTMICKPTSNRTKPQKANQFRQNQTSYDKSPDICLEELRLNHNNITEIDPHILQYVKLKTLDISNNKISDWKHVETLTKLENLTNLTIHSNDLKITENSTPSIQKVKKFEIREDISAHLMKTEEEAAYRRYILSLFQHKVGKENKLHIQLIVLDMKRVKNKWTHKSDDHVSNSTNQVSNTSDGNSKKNKDNGVVKRKREDLGEDELNSKELYRVGVTKQEQKKVRIVENTVGNNSDLQTDMNVVVSSQNSERKKGKESNSAPLTPAASPAEGLGTSDANANPPMKLNRKETRRLKKLALEEAERAKMNSTATSGKVAAISPHVDLNASDANASKFDDYDGVVGIRVHDVQSANSMESSNKAKKKDLKNKKDDAEIAASDANKDISSLLHVNSDVGAGGNSSWD